MHWTRFLRWFLGSFLLVAGALYAFILVMDPYEDVPFSPPLKRAPIAQNQRYSYPAVARDPAFESAVIGTSTLRLVDPALLDGPLRTRFANLAMNSATAYEELRMLELFVRHHPRPQYLVLGIDDSWCKQGTAPERYTFRGFPEWLYDANRWNDLLYLFNDKALENAVRMLQYARGKRRAKYARSGYKDFTAEFGSFELATIRRRVYGAAHANAPPAFGQLDLEPAAARPDLKLPNLEHLAPLLARVPAATRLVLVFPPFHAWHLAQEAHEVRECKARVLAAVAARPGLGVVDYMLDTALTRDDTQYWDALHPHKAVADRLARTIAAVLAGEAPTGAEFRVRRRLAP
ncbi:MAG: hypothetical protein HY749_08435 [Gammaproteobacteria bacterium]|nr:hypothetical protein [Gammaproteobacteria bacterium]